MVKITKFSISVVFVSFITFTTGGGPISLKLKGSMLLYTYYVNLKIIKADHRRNDKYVSFIIIYSNSCSSSMYVVVKFLDR